MCKDRAHAYRTRLMDGSDVPYDQVHQKLSFAFSQSKLLGGYSRRVND